MTASNPSKVVIFAGGQGTRLSEMTGLIPKPLVPIGPDPIVVHIMRHFYNQGVKEFILAVGYKSEQFKHYFRDYQFLGRSVSFNPYGTIVHGKAREDWTVHVVETGEDATTGQRLDAVREYIGDDDFYLTYGDSLSDVNLTAVVAAHNSGDKLVTITAVSRQERFGILSVADGVVNSFSEKADGPENLINGGFMVCSNELLKRVSHSAGDFAHETLTKLAEDGALGYYHHRGFWHAMDTKGDMDKLNKLYIDHPDLFKVKEDA
jgi:glucose-1-phosphate cytidylyltransferase